MTTISIYLHSFTLVFIFACRLHLNPIVIKCMYWIFQYLWLTLCSQSGPTLEVMNNSTDSDEHKKNNKNAPVQHTFGAHCRFLQCKLNYLVINHNAP